MMIKLSNVAALLAVAALPACSMFGGHSDRASRANAPSPSVATAAAAAPTQEAVQTPVTPELIRSVQEALQRDGKYGGHVDGVWGPRTQAAVRNYQQQHSISATGQLDQPTLTAMNLAGTGTAAAPPPAGSSSTSTYNPLPATGAPEPNVNPPPATR